MMKNPEADCAKTNVLVFTNGIKCLEEKLETEGGVMPEEQQEAYRKTIESWKQKRKEYYDIMSDYDKWYLWLQYGISM